MGALRHAGSSVYDTVDVLGKFAGQDEFRETYGLTTVPYNENPPIQRLSMQPSEIF
jgi:hypothetical protein